MRVRILTAIAVVLLLAACGGDQAGEGTDGTEAGDASPAPAAEDGAAAEDGEPAAADGGATTLEFVGVDIDYSEAPEEAPAGPATIVLVNEGQLPHTVTIDEFDFEVYAEAGETVEGDVELEPGTYEYYCSVPGHRQAGMVGEIDIS